MRDAVDDYIDGLDIEVKPPTVHKPVKRERATDARSGLSEYRQPDVDAVLSPFGVSALTMGVLFDGL